MTKCAATTTLNPEPCTFFLQIHLIGQYGIDGGDGILPCGDRVIHLMFVEFIIDVFHVDPDIQDGGVDAGHGKLGSHDGVADGVLISFEEKVREAREQIAHGLRHLLRDFDRFLES